MLTHYTSTLKHLKSNMGEKAFFSFHITSSQTSDRILKELKFIITSTGIWFQTKVGKMFLFLESKLKTAKTDFNSTSCSSFNDLSRSRTQTESRG